MQFNLCENTGFFLRLALIGPAGSGKSYTALQIATELGFENVAVIDTENRSARRYARAFRRRFKSCELAHFSPRDYIEAMRAAEAAGVEVLIIDSLSHAWAGKGGVLEMVDQSAKRQSRGGNPSSFSGWREVTPEHNRLVEALVQVRLHLIITMRTKTEYVVDKDEKGRAVPRKVGLQPVQRDGLEYEFDVVGDLSPEHELCISKSRCPVLADAIISKPGVEMARTLRAWVDGGAAEEPADERPGDPPVARPDDTAPATPVGAKAPPPVRPHGLDGEELAAVAPWLQRIQEAERSGSEERLDQVRTEMNAALRKRTRAQGEALRRALESAKAAIQAGRPGAPEGPSAEELEALEEESSSRPPPSGGSARSRR